MTFIFFLGDFLRSSGGFVTVKSRSKPLFVLQQKYLLYIAPSADVEFIVFGS